MPEFPLVVNNKRDTDIYRLIDQMPGLPGCGAWSPAEPDVFHAPAVEEAVDHDRQPLDLRLAAGREAVVVEDRAGAVFLQLAVDVPDETAAFVLVRFGGLPVEQLVDP